MLLAGVGNLAEAGEGMAEPGSGLLGQDELVAGAGTDTGPVRDK
jgi:hypothetical protein